MSARDLNEDQRWQVADRLDEIPSACWADLVSWALKGTAEVEVGCTGEVVDSPIPDTTSGAWCAMNATHEGGCCYCGKFRTGLEVTDGR